MVAPSHPNYFSDLRQEAADAAAAERVTEKVCRNAGVKKYPQADFSPTLPMPVASATHPPDFGRRLPHPSPAIILERMANRLFSAIGIIALAWLLYMILTTPGRD